jgi:hypothetical protein
MPRRSRRRRVTAGLDGRGGRDFRRGDLTALPAASAGGWAIRGGGSSLAVVGQVRGPGLVAGTAFLTPPAQGAQDDRSCYPPSERFRYGTSRQPSAISRQLSTLSKHCSRAVARVQVGGRMSTFVPPSLRAEACPPWRAPSSLRSRIAQVPGVGGDRGEFVGVERRLAEIVRIALRRTGTDARGGVHPPFRLRAFVPSCLRPFPLTDRRNSRWRGR